VPSWRPKQGEEEGENKPRPLVPAKDLCGGAAPRFGSMADVAMESNGKAAGGWAAVARLGVEAILNNSIRIAH
jgi:hypothetical protein